ncbi:MAG: hypothetical protein ACTSVE_00040 [Candidatus Helarchaeota archaeon]
MRTEETYPDDMAEFLFGRNYKRIYKANLFSILHDGFGYLRHLGLIFGDIFNLDLIKSLFKKNDFRNRSSISLSNLDKLIKLNVAIFKKLEEINKDSSEK